MNIEELSFGYSPERVLIKDLSLAIGKQDRICVIGKNGKGKSTLLRLMAGELKPVAGKISRHPDCQIGYFGQTNIERLNPDMTIEKELQRIRPDLSYTDIRKTCGAMMFTGDLALKEISVLSGGEKSRVSLGKILLSPSNMLLLDEPTNHLDVESCDSMIAALDDFPGAVVIVTHSEMFLHHIANRLIVFNHDKVFVFEGTYQDFLDRVGWEDEPKKQSKEKKADKEKRRQQALEAEFNKKSKALHAKIEKIEKHIDVEEKALEDANLKIAQSAGKAGGEEIQKLQIKAHKHQEALDAGYSELEKLIAEQDALSSPVL